MGKTGAIEIKEHPFFNGINFSQVEGHQLIAPWKPSFDDPEDTNNFDFDFDVNPGPMPDDDTFHDNDDDNGNQFYGFTFRRFLTNGGPPPTFFQGQNSLKSSNKSDGKQQTVDAVYV